MRFREVSALTNQGVYEAFKLLVSDINSDPILLKQSYDQEKMRNKDKDEFKDVEVSTSTH